MAYELFFIIFIIENIENIDNIVKLIQLTFIICGCDDDGNSDECG